MTDTNTRKSPLKWIIIGGLALLAIQTLFSYQGLVNTEENYRASDKKLYTSLDAVVKKITSTGAVVKDYREAQDRIITAYVGQNGRGSAAFINAVKEAFPTFDPALHRDLVVTINAAYTDFEAAQNTKIEVGNSYRKALRSPFNMIAKSIGGFPTIDMEDLDRLIIGGEAKDAQQSGQFDTVDPGLN